MSETVLEQSLQIVLQESTAATALVALVAAALVGMSIRKIVESVVTTGEGEPISDGGTTGAVAGRPADPDGGTVDRIVTGESTDEEESTDENLEGRLDELEHEVETLSSTVNTVRNENEQISESVRDIEENTGRLLNLYEMATRGVNPFSGKQEAANRHESGVREETETIETDVADPDAATLFDGSEDAEAAVREEHCVDSVEEVVETGTEPADAFQKRKQSTEPDGADDGVEEIHDAGEATVDTGEDLSDWMFGDEKIGDDGPDTAAEEPDGEAQFGTEETIETPSPKAASDGGTFAELPGETEPDEETDTASERGGEAAGSDVGIETEIEADAESDRAADSRPGSADAAATGETQARPDPVPEPAPAGSPGLDSLPEGGPEERVEAGSTPASGPTATTPRESAGATGSKPYIDSLPEGFAAEVITVEWLEYLIEHVGLRETVRAIHYYENIDWLTEEAAAELDAYLDGFDAAESGTLSVEHHLRSLDYVEELTATGGTDPEDATETPEVGE